MASRRLMPAGVHTGDGYIHFMKVRIPKLEDVLAPKKFLKDDKLLLRKEELVLVRVITAGICGTDLHILKGEHDSAPPVILGHEYVGIVVDRGSVVENVNKGDFVGVDPNVKCGFCKSCISGKDNMCKNMTTLGIFTNGGFAQYSLVPAKQVYRLLSIPSERAVFFEPLSCVVNGLQNIGGIFPGESVLVYGGGPIGCLFTALAIRQGASSVVVVEPSQFRAQFAKKMGAVVIQPGFEHVFPQFDIVIEASGIPSVVPRTFDRVRDGGRVLLFGQQDPKARVVFCPTIINQKELQVLGSYAATRKSFEATTKILADMHIPLENLITHVISLSDIEKAFELLEKREALKILIDPWR